MKSPAVQAVIAQSEFSELQRLGVNFWDAATAFGNQMAKGNTGGEDLQTLLDNTVKKIKASVVG